MFSMKSISSNPFFLLFLPIFPFPAMITSPNQWSPGNVTMTSPLPPAKSPQMQQRATIFNITSLAQIESCDFWGLTVYITRNPATHRGIPYIAGHPHDKSCPELIPGPTKNEWYFSWSLQEMGQSLCGKLNNLTFTTQINIGECDCEFMTDKDYTSVISCEIMQGKGHTKSGDDPANPPEEAKLTLSQETAVIPQTIDVYLTQQFKMPTVKAAIRKSDGTEVTPTDVIMLGQPLEIFIEIVVSHDYWTHLAVEKMVMRGLVDKSKSFDVITGMCLGTEEIQGAEGSSSPYSLIPASQLQICTICQAAISKFGVTYDSTTPHGQTIIIPFNMFTFREETDHGVEIFMNLHVCHSMSMTSCYRTDCPMASRKRRRAYSQSYAKGTTSGDNYTSHPPSLAKYDVNLLLKVNSQNKTSTSRQRTPHIVAHAPSTTPDVLAEEQSYRKGLWMEIALIIMGVLVVFTLIIPCLYAVYHDRRLQQEAQGGGGIQEVEVVKVLDPQLIDEGDCAVLVKNGGLERQRPQPKTNHPNIHCDPPPRCHPSFSSPRNKSTNLPTKQLFADPHQVATDFNHQMSTNENLAILPIANSSLDDVYEDDDSILLSQYFPNMCRSHANAKGKVKLTNGRDGCTCPVDATYTRDVSAKKSSKLSAIKSFKKVVANGAAAVVGRSEYDQDHKMRASDSLPVFVCSRGKITMEPCNDSEV